MYHRRKYFRTKLTNIILMSGGISNKMRPAFSFDKTISYNYTNIYNVDKATTNILFFSFH